MPPTPLATTVRYFPPGIRKTYWVQTIGNYNAPTRAEINAGIDLSAQVQAINGWSVTSNAVDTPDMGSRFVSQVPGRLTSATNEITCYTSQTSYDARDLLLRDLNGNILQLWEGDVTGQKMDVFPVRVMSQAMDSNIENPGACVFAFAVTQLPAIHVAIP
jgi:hypothetical protein